METSVAAILSTLSTGFNAAEGAIITSVSSWFGPELLKLGIAEIVAISESLSHFIGKLRAGVAWGAAMAGMLTELWNDTQDALKTLVTDFVEAVGKVFQSVGLVAAAA